MIFNQVRTLEEFASLKQPWNALLEKSASHVPFLRHEFLFSWWQTLGGGEWEEGELHIITARNDAGVLTGIAPLFSTTGPDGHPIMMFLGSHEIADYLDFIAPVPILETFIEGCLRFLANDSAFEWKRLNLYNLPGHSPSIPALKKAADSSRWKYDDTMLQPAPLINLPADWETYLAALKKKQRHEIRRKIRRAEQADLPIRWYIAEDDALLDDEIEAFFYLMSQDKAKAAFLTPKMRRQMRKIIRLAFENQWLQLAFIEIGGNKAAAYLNFSFGNRVWVYNSGINYGFGKYSPGWVLLGYLIRKAIEDGYEIFDFMRGDEEYKYRFGGINRYVHRLMLEKS